MKASDDNSSIRLPQYCSVQQRRCRNLVTTSKNSLELGQMTLRVRPLEDGLLFDDIREPVYPVQCLMSKEQVHQASW